METPVLREIRLTAFKSFHNAVLPVDATIVLTGRNSSGKSNALDGIEVLSRLAGGEEIGDALDGRRREGGAVRGGSRGCAPHGTDRFTLGCTVMSGGDRFEYDVTIQVDPELRVIDEELVGPAPAVASGHVQERDLLRTLQPNPDDTGIFAEIYNGKRGLNPAMPFRDSRLVLSQLPLRLLPRNDADAAVVRGAEAVMAALRGVFHLDPIPHLMRDYISERDGDLRRTGENLSAAIAKLMQEDPPTFARLEDLVRAVADERIGGIEVRPSELGDVMLALREGRDVTPAREMSDGLLRFMAIATALLTSNVGLDIDAGLSAEGPAAGVLLVIEELENGLHPSQAERVLELIREASRGTTTQVMVTTHSPALLNAMSGAGINSVVVCYRDVGGVSRLSRLPALPGYAEAMAIGRLGEVVSQGRLVRPEETSRDFTELNRLLGIDTG